MPSIPGHQRHTHPSIHPINSEQLKKGIIYLFIDKAALKSRDTDRSQCLCIGSRSQNSCNMFIQHLNRLKNKLFSEKIMWYSPKYMSFFYSHPSGGRAMFQFPNEFSMREVGRFFVVFSFIYSDLFSEIKRVQCRTWRKTNTLSCLCVTGPHHVGWKHVGH